MENREQAAKQCDAVVHLCKALIELHEDRAKRLRGGTVDDLIDITGRRTAYIMETLGDVLNGMDAVDEKEDAWLDPIFAEAHRLWPQPTQ